MNEDSDFPAPDETGFLRFVVPGTRLTYELTALGKLETALGHSILFCPVLSGVGWFDRKELVASLRLKHLASGNREIGRCLLDRDEALAWASLLRSMQNNESCGDRPELQTTNFEFATRHGIRWVWERHADWDVPLYQLHVSSMQPAILPDGFLDQLLTIFDNFESLCSMFQ